MKYNWSFSSPNGGKGREEADKLILSGKPLSYGIYSTDIPLTGSWVHLDACCETENIISPETAVTVMLSFFRDDKTPIRRQYITPKQADNCGKLIYSRVFEIPEETASCKIELALRWPRSGSVTFNEPELTLCSPPDERIARVVVTHFKQGVTAGQKAIHERIGALVDKISVNKPDLVCFCEMLQGLEKEPIDGPFVKLLSQSAIKCNSYMIGNFMEDTGDEMFNTSVLIDRTGKLIGKYRKTHLPLSEVEMGISPGDTYPVFETDFAKVGMLICWDTSFPGVIGSLCKNGAELVVNSTVGDFWQHETARARDNGVWLATAGAHRLENSHIPPSRIYDPTGTLVASTGDGTTDTFTYIDIDFNKCFYQFWASVGPCDGEPPSLFKVEHRPETYD